MHANSVWEVFGGALVICLFFLEKTEGFFTSCGCILSLLKPLDSFHLVSNSHWLLSFNLKFTKLQSSSFKDMLVLKLSSKFHYITNFITNDGGKGCLPQPILKQNPPPSYPSTPSLSIANSKAIITLSKNIHTSNNQNLALDLKWQVAKI